MNSDGVARGRLSPAGDVGPLPDPWHEDPFLAEEGPAALASARFWATRSAVLFDRPGLTWLGLGDPARLTGLIRGAAGDLSVPQEATLPAGTWSLLAAADVPAATWADRDASPPFTPVPAAWQWRVHVGAPAAGPEDPPVVELDPAREVSHLWELADLQQRVLPESYLRLDAPGARWFGIRDPGGFLRAMGGATGWPHHAHLGSIVTDPQWRGRGLGGALVAGMIRRGRAEAGHVSLSAYSANAAALRLYARCGFVPVYRFESRTLRPVRVEGA